MGIRLQKVFDVYASKKSLAVSALKFVFDGQRLIGDMTPEALGKISQLIYELRIFD